MLLLPALSRLVRRTPGAALAVALATVAPDAAAQADLKAQLVSGPGIVHVNTKALVTIDVANLGDPLAGDITTEVVLSQDLVIDAGDPIVGSFTDSILGLRTVLCDVPLGLPDVPHVWGLRVLPAPGEVNVADNIVLGLTANVIKVDLALADPAPITVAVNLDDDLLEPIPVTVRNAGTAGGILVFTVEDLGNVPWLTIDPPSSFAIGGETGNDVSLRFDHTALPAGTYSTTLRFESWILAADAEELEVTLTVGPARFIPGDRFQGQISEIGETDEIAVDAVQGLLLKLRLKTQSGNLKPRIEVIDPDGIVEKVIAFKASSEWIERKYKVKRSGDYLLRIRGAGDSLGGYAVRTGRALPKKAHPRVVKVKGPAPAEVPVLLLPGAYLEFSATPNSAFDGPLSLGLETPSGAMFDITTFARPGPKGGLIVEGLQVTDCGRYDIRVAGFGGQAGENVKVHVLPSQPQKGKGKIYLK